jgi:hypothetical protein
MSIADLSTLMLAVGPESKYALAVGMSAFASKPDKGSRGLRPPLLTHFGSHDPMPATAVIFLARNSDWLTEIRLDVESV